MTGADFEVAVILAIVDQQVLVESKLKLVSGSDGGDAADVLLVGDMDRFERSKDRAGETPISHVLVGIGAAVQQVQVNALAAGCRSGGFGFRLLGDLSVIVIAGAIQRRVEIEVPGVGPMEQIGQQIAEAVFVITSGLLTEGADRFVGLVGAVEIGCHDGIPLSCWEATAVGPR